MIGKFGMSNDINDRLFVFFEASLVRQFLKPSLNFFPVSCITAVRNINYGIFPKLCSKEILKSLKHVLMLG